jgi:hypothetical protein
MSPIVAYVLGLISGAIFTVVAYSWFELIAIWRDERR